MSALRLAIASKGWEEDTLRFLSQCGLRVYPLAMVTMLRCGAERFGFETEIITRTGWAGAQVREVVCGPLPFAAAREGHHRAVARAHQPLELGLRLAQRARRAVGGLRAQLDLLARGKR